MRHLFRMYVSESCPVCAQARAFMDSRKMDVEYIVVGFDPVINKGLSLVLNNPNPMLPFLVCQATQEMVAGFTPENYEQVVRSYHSLFSAESRRPDIAGRQHPTASSNLAVGTSPPPSGATGVRPVSGVLGGPLPHQN
jgi:arsenate reductase-like glutaredoxin family protein